MAGDETARGGDPHLGLRFWIELNGIEVAGFTDCSGLSVETEVMEYNEGGWNAFTHKLPVRVKYSNVTLKRGLNAGRELYDWVEKGLNGNPVPRRSITINIYDPAGKQVRQWVLREAYPVKWSAPDLKTDAGAVTIESLEFAHHGILSSDRAGVHSDLKLVRNGVQF
jgi:phage tail-like protein